MTVATNAGGQNLDKTWIACDNVGSGGASPPDSYYGNCYATWDDFRHGDRLKMSEGARGQGVSAVQELQGAKQQAGLRPVHRRRRDVAAHEPLSHDHL